MMDIFCEEPFSHDNDMAGVIATTTEKVFILYQVSLTISSFLPVYIPQAKAWGFDGKSVNVFWIYSCLVSFFDKERNLRTFPPALSVVPAVSSKNP